MGWWTTDRKRYALDYLTGAGLSIFGAAGLVSRWANVESIADGPFAVNPASGAFGIAQWLTPSRLNPIRGNTDFDAQLAYVVSELNSSEWRAGELLRNAGTVQEGAIGATVYERAEHYNAGTGTDDHTGRTASGIPAIIALAETTTPTPGVFTNGEWQPNEDQTTFVGGGGISAPVMIGVGFSVLFLLRRLGII